MDCDLFGGDIHIQHNIINHRDQNILALSWLHYPDIIRPRLQDICNRAQRLASVFICVDFTADNMMEVIFVLRKLHQIVAGNLKQAAFILLNLVDISVALQLGNKHTLMLFR
ncbi:hypothetical protein D3C80_1420290 [compost metagenome]